MPHIWGEIVLEKWFSRRLAKRAAQPDGRAGLIRLAGVAGIVANVAFAAVKLLVGMAEAMRQHSPGATVLMHIDLDYS